MQSHYLARLSYPKFSESVAAIDDAAPIITLTSFQLVCRSLFIYAMTIGYVFNLYLFYYLSGHAMLRSRDPASR